MILVVSFGILIASSMLTSNLRKNDFCESLKFTASFSSVKVIALSSGNKSIFYTTNTIINLRYYSV